MNLVPNGAAPSLYLRVVLPGEKVSLPWISTLLRLSFNASSVPTNGSLLFPIWSRQPLSSLTIFYCSRGEHGLPIVGSKMATAMLLSFSLLVGYRHRLRHRSCDSRR